VWDADTGTEQLVLKGHTGRVLSVVFSPDGKHIVTGGGADFKPGEVKVWDAEAGADKILLK
jgi:WD40 repeat protein